MSTNNRKGPIVDPGVCRCCGAVKKCRLLNVEYEWSGQREVYADMFVDCFGLVLSHMEGEESERLICATCVVRLRDARAFRQQVLLCEEKLLTANLHVHDDNENNFKMEVEVKQEVDGTPLQPANDSDEDDDTHATDPMEDTTEQDEETMKASKVKIESVLPDVPQVPYAASENKTQIINESAVETDCNTSTPPHLSESCLTDYGVAPSQGSKKVRTRVIQKENFFSRRSQKREKELRKLIITEKEWMVKAAAENYLKMKVERQAAEELLHCNRAKREVAKLQLTLFRNKNLKL